LAGNSDAPIRVICGPTGAGKTFAASWFSQLSSLAVISADSRQVYRGFNIGTAKPSKEELRAIPHYGVDVLDPSERCSAAWWASHADRWIDDALARGCVPVVVGGTGLYLRALFGTLFDEPPLDPVQRSGLQEVLVDHPTEELRRWVATLDPARSHLGRVQLLRAIEIALLTGHRVSDLHREQVRPARRRARYLVIDPGPSLADSIAERTHQMLSRGWREEVRNLMKTIPEDAPAWNASGYRMIRALEQGTVTEAEAERRVAIETRQYAKRQRTWFRHQLAGADVTRLSTAQPDWAERATAWWREGNA